MKNRSFLALALLTAVFAVGCSKPSEGDKATPAPEASAPAKAAKATGPARVATYNPNLKPAEIVWDSPQKKAEWEQRQAQLRAMQAQRAAQAVAPRVSPPAAPAQMAKPAQAAN